MPSAEPAGPVLARVAVLLALYVAASFTLDPGGSLGTDTGAKVATLDHMVESGTWRPAVPYWAEDLDPEGRLHPVYDSARVDGRWVHVTTLPMLLAARPLYDLGGYRLTLLLPMGGAIATALAARALARRIGGREAGERALWLVGVASPLAVYALDLWEHALGVACVVAAVAALAGVVDGAGGRWRAPVAGVLFGVAATMRTESVVYAVVAVAGVVGVLLVGRRIGRAAATGALAVAGFAVPWLANRALEDALGGTDRTERATGAAGGFLSDLGDRAEEALLTLLGARPGPFGSAVTLGGLLALGVAAAVVLRRRGRADLAPAAVVVVAVLHVVVLADRGLGFVPGMLVAAPLAVVALAGPWSGRPRAYALGVAVGSLPLVWGFQYLGGAGPQWGGRYLLPSCLLLVAVASAVLPALGRGLAVALAGLGLAVTASGVAWLAERSHAVDAWFAAATERPEDVLIARNGFLVREAGAASDDRRWLTAVGERDLAAAVEVVERAGLRTFAVVDEAPRAPDRLGRAELVGTDRTELLRVDLYLHRYELAP